MRLHFVIFFLWATLGLLLTLSAFGQSSFELANKHTPIVNAPVFDAQGVPLEGANYLAELWGASTPNSLAPLADVNGGGGRKILSFRSGGYFGASEVSVTTVPPNGWAWLQVRAWDARLGSTYEEVATRGMGGYGESPLFYEHGSDPTTANGLLPSPLTGLKSFSLRAAAAVLFRAITRQNDQVVLEWDPGFKRYQLEQTSALDQPWGHLGEPTTNLTATVKLDSPTRFFRIIGLLD